MQINGSIPFHVAQAYGVKRAAPLQSPAPIHPAASAHSIDKLIASKVTQSVNFDAAITPPHESAPSLQLYTRAADKVEAAVSIQIGRSIDLCG